MLEIMKCSLFTACTSCTRVYSVQFGMAAEDECVLIPSTVTVQLHFVSQQYF